MVERINGRRQVTVTEGSQRDIRAELVLLAIGFDGTEPQPLLDQFGVTRNARGAVDAGNDWQTDVDGVFVAGDMHRGASLIVWAIAEGRAAAAAIHNYLGAFGDLPAPVAPRRNRWWPPGRIHRSAVVPQWTVGDIMGVCRPRRRGGP